MPALSPHRLRHLGHAPAPFLAATFSLLTRTACQNSAPACPTHFFARIIAEALLFGFLRGRERTSLRVVVYDRVLSGLEYSECLALVKGTMIRIIDDQMVQKSNSDQVARLTQVLRDFSIFIARRQVA